MSVQELLTRSIDTQGHVGCLLGLESSIVEIESRQASRDVISGQSCPLKLVLDFEVLPSSEHVIIKTLHATCGFLDKILCHLPRERRANLTPNLPLLIMKSFMNSCASSRDSPAPIMAFPCLNASGRLPWPLQFGDPPGRQVPLFIRWEDYIRKVIPRRRFEDVTFVQIGANCGKNTFGCAVGGDPIWSYATMCGWHGVVVEPVSYVFKKLCKNYARWPQVIPMRAAISDAPGITLMSLGAGEMNKVIMSKNHIGAQVRAPRRNESVPALTLGMLWQQALNATGPREIDILIVDAEGQEEAILAGPGGASTFPSPPPPLILFERAHLSKRQEKRIDVALRLQGYQLLVMLRNGDPVGANRHTPPANSLYGRMDPHGHSSPPSPRSSVGGPNMDTGTAAE